MKSIYLICIFSFLTTYPVVKVAHRGASGYELENTVSAFKKAIDLKADYIELDVWSSCDGQLVVMHDQFINRTTNGRGNIKKLSLQQLKKSKSRNGDPISTLKQVIDVVDKRSKLMIEIKDDNIQEKLKMVLEHAAKNGWKHDDFIISSFKIKELQKLRAIMPKINIAVLFERVPKNYLKIIQGIKSKIVIVDKSHLNKKLITEMHKNDLQVYVYTVNSLSEINKFKQMNIDGIISDFPDRI